ncbi:MAG: hypothetical protein PHC34_06275 [Candidatus Gastranaerophilales bacterium]|nr:hypothetical protein [Candidatus Gastranaerophilales bacterium]
MINALAQNISPDKSNRNRAYLNFNNTVENSFAIQKNEQNPNFRQKVLFYYIPQPISFKYYFAFKELENLPCPCCGRTMTTNKEIEDFVKNMTIAKGKDIAVCLEKYKDRLPDTERNVANILIKSAKKNENLQLDELLKQILKEPKQKLETKQREILKEIADLSKGLTGETYKIIQKDISQIDSIIKKGRNGDPFKRKKLIQGLEKVRDNESNPDNKKILENIVIKAEDIPTSGADAEAFIVKYSRRKPSEIAHRIIEPSQSTAEHIRPHCKEGSNSPANYLAECKKCNNDRGNMSYVDWLKIHPEMIDNSQKYMNEIIHRIIIGEIKGFDYYPQAVKKAIYDESGQQINLDISKMDEHKKEKLSKTKQARLALPSDVQLNVFA